MSGILLDNTQPPNLHCTSNGRLARGLRAMGIAGGGGGGDSTAAQGQHL